MKEEYIDPNEKDWYEKESLVYELLTKSAASRLKRISLAHHELYVRIVDIIYDLYVKYGYRRKIDTEDLKRLIAEIKGQFYTFNKYKYARVVA